MSGLTSKRKGDDYERDLARRLSKRFGIKLMRTPLSGGLKFSFSGDLMRKDIGGKRSIFDWFVPDGKRRAKFSRELFADLDDLRTELRRNVSRETVALHIWRFDNDPNEYAVMNFEDFVGFLKRIEPMITHEQ